MTSPSRLERVHVDRRSLVRRETLLGAGFLAVAVVLMIGVLTGATQHFDEQARRWFQDVRSEHLDLIFRQVTALGNFLTLVTLSVGLAVTLHYAMRVRAVWFIVCCLVGGRLLHMVLRIVVDRPRPILIETLFSIDGSSFPSGHAMMSAVVYPTFALLIAEQIEQRAVRNGLLAAAFVLVAFIGVSRLYLGVHYVTDVVAGFSAGLFWLSACWEVRAQLIDRRSRRN